MTLRCYLMTYSKGLHKRSGKRYGRSMNITSLLPGTASLAYHTPSLSREAKRRLQWFDWYRAHGENAALTCRHFGIPRKTFYAWKKRYNPWNLSALENRSCRPRKTRNWDVSRMEEFRILSLRRKHIRWGKMKLKERYQTIHGIPISSWKIQRVIEKHNLYFHPAKAAKARKKRSRYGVKLRIHTLEKQARTGFLIALDTIVRYWNGTKRYIFTAIDVHSKIAFARMYTTKSSKNAADFLRRIHYLLEGKVEHITRDNGSEFAGAFETAAQELNMGSWYSRVKTPTDNPCDERFNRTLEEEFIQLGNMSADCILFNRKLTEWLIEYNFTRPHQTLDYMVPVEYHNKYSGVSPMYPSCTQSQPPLEMTDSAYS